MLRMVRSGAVLENMSFQSCGRDDRVFSIGHIIAVSDCQHNARRKSTISEQVEENGQ